MDEARTTAIGLIALGGGISMGNALVAIGIQINVIGIFALAICLVGLVYLFLAIRKEEIDS